MMTIKGLKRGTLLFRGPDRIKNPSTGRLEDVGEGYYEVDTAEYGRMTLDQWADAMAAAVEAEGRAELLEDIIAACRRLPWMKTEKERRYYALDVISIDAYKSWPEFTTIII